MSLTVAGRPSHWFSFAFTGIPSSLGPPNRPRLVCLGEAVNYSYVRDTLDEPERE
jgi:hypothetical protein